MNKWLIVYRIVLFLTKYASFHWRCVDGLVQERRNSIVGALQLHLSCTDPSIYDAVSPVVVSMKVAFCFV